MTNIFKKIRKFPKKFLIIGAIIIALVFFFVSKNNKPIPPQFAKASIQDLKQEVSASGIVTGKDSAQLKFASGGKLAYMNVKTGDKVKKWDAIAGLDTYDLLAALRIAQSNFRDKKAIADKIHDDLNGVGASETFAQKETRTTAEVAQDNAYDTLLSAQQALRDAVLISPIDGTITQADPIPGQVVLAADTIAKVVDFSQVIFAADIDESDISKVKLGQKAEITLNAYGDTIFKGTVVEIGTQTRTTSNGATVVTVKVAFDDQSVEHIDGLNGQVNIITSEKDHVLSVPIDALQNGIVLVKSGTGIKKEKVSTGFQTDTDIEITDGLSAGDQVVINPADIKQ